MMNHAMHCFWADDPSNVLRRKWSLLPDENAPVCEKLNALTLWVLIVALILFFMQKKWWWVVLATGIGVVLVARLMYGRQSARPRPYSDIYNGSPRLETAGLEFFEDEQGTTPLADALKPNYDGSTPSPLGKQIGVDENTAILPPPHRGGLNPTLGDPSSALGFTASDREIADSQWAYLPGRFGAAGIGRYAHSQMQRSDYPQWHQNHHNFNFRKQELLGQLATMPVQPAELDNMAKRRQTAESAFLRDTSMHRKAMVRDFQARLDREYRQNTVEPFT